MRQFIGGNKLVAYYWPTAIYVNTFLIEECKTIMNESVWASSYHWMKYWMLVFWSCICRDDNRITLYIKLCYEPFSGVYCNVYLWRRSVRHTYVLLLRCAAALRSVSTLHKLLNRTQWPDVAPVIDSVEENVRDMLTSQWPIMFGGVDI